MDPIPILSIFDGFAAFVAFVSTVKLYFSWRETKQENVGYFFATYFLMGFFFFVISWPGIILKDPTQMQIVFSFSYIPLLLGLACLLVIPLNILGFFEEKAIVFLLVGSLLIAFMISNYMFFVPAIPKILGNLIYWHEGLPDWLIKIEGGTAVILALVSSIFFLGEGFQSKERVIKIRSFLVGTGILILVGAGFFNYLVTPNAFLSASTQVIIQIFVGLLLAAGFLILLAGISYKQTFAQKAIPINPPADLKS